MSVTDTAISTEWILFQGAVARLERMYLKKREAGCASFLQDKIKAELKTAKQKFQDIGGDAGLVFLKKEIENNLKKLSGPKDEKIIRKLKEHQVNLDKLKEKHESVVVLEGKLSALESVVEENKHSLISEQEESVKREIGEHKRKIENLFFEKHCADGAAL